MSVWHENVEPDEQQRHYDVGQQVYHNAYRRSQQVDIRHGVCHGGEKETQSRNNHYRDREEEEHCHIVGKRAEQCSLFLHLPDAVECPFDVHHKDEYSVEHNNKTNSKKNPAFCVYKIAVYKTDDGVGHCRL